MGLGSLGSNLWIERIKSMFWMSSDSCGLDIRIKKDLKDMFLNSFGFIPIKYLNREGLKTCFELNSYSLGLGVRIKNDWNYV